MLKLLLDDWFDVCQITYQHLADCFWNIITILCIMRLWLSWWYQGSTRFKSICMYVVSVFLVCNNNIRTYAWILSFSLVFQQNISNGFHKYASWYCAHFVDFTYCIIMVCIFKMLFWIFITFIKLIQKNKILM